MGMTRALLPGWEVFGFTSRKRHWSSGVWSYLMLVYNFNIYMPLESRGAATVTSPWTSSNRKMFQTGQL